MAKRASITAAFAETAPNCKSLSSRASAGVAAGVSVIRRCEGDGLIHRGFGNASSRRLRYTCEPTRPAAPRDAQLSYGPGGIPQAVGARPRRQAAPVAIRRAHRLLGVSESQSSPARVARECGDELERGDAGQGVVGPFDGRGQDVWLPVAGGGRAEGGDAVWSTARDPLDGDGPDDDDRRSLRPATRVAEESGRLGQVLRANVQARGYHPGVRAAHRVRQRPGPGRLHPHHEVRARLYRMGCKGQRVLMEKGVRWCPRGSVGPGTDDARRI